MSDTTATKDIASVSDGQQSSADVEKPQTPTVDDKPRERTESESADSNPDPHFDPVIELPLVDIKSLEENEEEILKLRAKLYRYDTSEETPEFKERGTGEVKLLRHKNIRAVRILMRRDKTLKLCANHYIMPSMELKKHQNSEKVFVWNTFADLSEETPTRETLAIRFGNAENAQKFKQAFEESKEWLAEDDQLIANSLNQMHIKDNGNNNEDESSSSSSDDSEDTDNEKENNDQKETKDNNEDKSVDK